MAQIDVIGRLRIVCMECPAVATLHHIESEAWQDCILVWCSCHDEHVLAIVDSIVLRRLAVDEQGRQLNVPMSALKPLDVDDVVERRNETEHLLMMLGKRLQAYEHFLAQGGPKFAPSTDEATP